MAYVGHLAKGVEQGFQILLDLEKEMSLIMIDYA
jgi:hypothetical protein